jgi:hypothetical protein
VTMKTTEIQAGRETDALVAERVMGWAWQTKDGSTRWLAPPAQCGDFGHERPASGDEALEGAWWLEAKPSDLHWIVPHYSTDIAAAWQVVESVVERGYMVTVVQEDDAAVRVYLDHPSQVEDLDEIGVAPTAPLAICRAALAAVEAP